MKANGFNKKQFIAVSLSERGSKSFTFLENAETGQRELYFIDNIDIGGVTGSTMLLGQFVFEIEKAPDAALKFTPGSTNRLYHPGDKRVSSYDHITEEEKSEIEKRLNVLLEEKPEHEEKIKYLLERL